MNYNSFNNDLTKIHAIELSLSATQWFRQVYNLMIQNSVYQINLSITLNIIEDNKYQ